MTESQKAKMFALWSEAVEENDKYCQCIKLRKPVEALEHDAKARELMAAMQIIEAFYNE